MSLSSNIFQNFKALPKEPAAAPTAAFSLQESNPHANPLCSNQLKGTQS